MTHTPSPLPEALARALSDEVLMESIAVAEPEYRGLGDYRCGISDLAKMRQVLLTALRPHWPTPERATWQPIETAPKDGSMIVVCDNYVHFAKTYWHHGAV